MALKVSLWATWWLKRKVDRLVAQSARRRHETALAIMPVEISLHLGAEQELGMVLQVITDNQVLSFYFSLLQT